MAIQYYGSTKIVFGIQDPKPIKAPAGQYRLKMSNKSAAALFIRTAEGIKKYILEDMDEYWLANPDLIQRASLKVKI